MKIANELEKLIQKKDGNRELAVFYFPDDDEDKWCLSLGNPSSSVMLGEVGGEIEVYGDSIKEVIRKAQEALSSY